MKSWVSPFRFYFMDIEKIYKEMCSMDYKPIFGSTGVGMVKTNFYWFPFIIFW